MPPACLLQFAASSGDLLLAATAIGGSGKTISENHDTPLTAPHGYSGEHLMFSAADTAHAFTVALLSISKTVLLVCGLAASAVPARMFSAGVVRAPDHRRVAANWLQFDTDACGKLDRFETRDKTASAVRASDPEDPEEDDEWVNAWDMSPSDSMRMNDWFAEHPDVAAVTSAIDKSCDDDAPTVLDDAEDSEIT